MLDINHILKCKGKVTLSGLLGLVYSVVLHVIQKAPLPLQNTNTTTLTRAFEIPACRAAYW